MGDVTLNYVPVRGFLPYFFKLVPDNSLFKVSSMLLLTLMTAVMLNLGNTFKSFAL